MDSRQPAQPGQLDDMFEPSDEEKFRESVSRLLRNGAPEARSLTPRAYVDSCRQKWREADSMADAVFCVRFIEDTLVGIDRRRRFERRNIFPTSAAKDPEPARWGDLYCCVLGLKDSLSGQFIGAPEGYSPPPLDPRVRRLIVPATPSRDQRSESENVEHPTEYAIALLDVLGFKRMLSLSGLLAVKEIYDKLVGVALRPCATASWEPFIDPTDVEGQCAGLAWLPISCGHFSDSLLLWVPLSPKYITPFLNRCIEVYCEALALGIVLRGAVVFGTAILHPSSGTFLGQPLVELFEAEKSQEWTGVVVIPPPAGLAQEVIIDSSAVMEYRAPLKPGRDIRSAVANPGADGMAAGPDLVLDWPRRWREVIGVSAADKLLELRGAGFEKYYDNSIAFVCESDRRPEQSLMQVGDPDELSVQAPGETGHDGSDGSDIAAVVSTVLPAGFSALDRFAAPRGLSGLAGNAFTEDMRQSVLADLRRLKRILPLLGNIRIREAGTTDVGNSIGAEAAALLAEFGSRLAASQLPPQGTQKAALVDLARKCISALGVDVSWEAGDAMD